MTYTKLNISTNPKDVNQLPLKLLVLLIIILIVISLNLFLFTGGDLSALPILEVQEKLVQNFPANQ